MVFSIFGKRIGFSRKPKNSPEASRVPAAKPKPAPAQPLEAPKGEDSLDFSTYIPPSKSELSGSEGLSGASAPIPRVLARGSAAPSATAASDDAAAVIENTAILFANGQVEQALSMLSRSVREADLRGEALQAWLMLFDLYQHLGMAVEFETLEPEFVVKFERSPPVWLETREHRDPALGTGDIDTFALSGTLSEASAPELDKLRSAALDRHAVRVDCGNLKGFDGPGCRLFRDTLLSIRASGKDVLLSGETQLLRFLEDACQPGRSETDGAVWALLLEIYRMLDFKDKFEEAAVNYAVTFEVSPPSWESKAGAEVKRAAAAIPLEAADQALLLSGELTGASEALAKQLRDWTAENKMLVIDMSQVRRVDFVTAGLMLNVLSKLHQAGTTIQIRGANQLIHALFRFMEIGKIARIIPRK